MHSYITLFCTLQRRTESGLSASLEWPTSSSPFFSPTSKIKFMSGGCSSEKQAICALQVNYLCRNVWAPASGDWRGTEWHGVAGILSEYFKNSTVVTFVGQSLCLLCLLRQMKVFKPANRESMQIPLRWSSRSKHNLLRGLEPWPTS